MECSAPDGSQIYLSNSPHLPPIVSVPLELVCYGFLLNLVYLNILASVSLSSFLRDRLASSRCLLLLLAVFDSLRYFATPATTHFRLAPYARVAMIGMTPTVLDSVKQSLHVLPAFIDILSLVLAAVAFFG